MENHLPIQKLTLEVFSSLVVKKLLTFFKYYLLIEKCKNILFDRNTSKVFIY